MDEEKKQRDWTQTKYTCLARISEEDRDWLKTHQVGKARTVAGKLYFIIKEYKNEEKQR